MKKSEKLYYSLGSVRDEWLDDAIGADITKNKAKSGGKTVALRRLLIAAAVCVLSVSLAITCVANADLIKSLFQREQELINPYAATIDESTETDGISMRMDKIAKDGDRYIIYLHLSRPEGFEPGFISYGEIAFEQKTDEGWVSKARISGANNANNALLAGIVLAEVEEKTNELDLLITVDNYSQVFNEVENGTLRLTVSELSTVQLVAENGGSAKYSEKYADELSVDFEFDESKIEPLPEKVSYPDIEFEAGGSKFKLTEMRYSPMHLELHFEDPIGQTQEIAGKELFAINKLNFSTYSTDYLPVIWPFEIGGPYTDEESKWLDENRKKSEEHTEWEQEHAEELEDLKRYVLNVETALEDNRWSIYHNFEIEDGEYNVNKLVLTWCFGKPMYEEDIRSISFMRYNEYPVTPENENNIDRVVVWENPNSVNPEEGNTAAE